MQVRLIFKFLPVFLCVIGASILAASPALTQYQVLEVAPVGSSSETQSGERGGRNPDTVPEGRERERADDVPFVWIVGVADDGVRIEGGVPAAAFQQFTAIRVPELVSDDTYIRADVPEGFITDALAVFDALQLLEKGRAGFDETGWFIEGALRETGSRDALETIVQAAETPLSEWRLAVNKPLLEVPEPDGTMAEPLEDAYEGQLSEASRPETAEHVESDPSESDTVMSEPAMAENGTESATGEEMPSDTVTPAPAPTVDYAFSAVKRPDGTVALSGFVPASLLQRLLETGTTDFDIARLRTRPSPPPRFIDAVEAGLAALSLLDTGQVILRDGGWILSGNAPIDTVSRSALDVLETRSSDVEWRTLINAPLAFDICSKDVAAYMADRAILFPSAGTVPTAASLEMLPGLVEILAVCPEVPVYVEGHTDADGSAEANLVLSIRRAESVVDALVDLGIDPARLYAVGYGASLPIATNATAEGKRQNRRIVFSFQDAAQPLQ